MIKPKIEEETKLLYIRKIKVKNIDWIRETAQSYGYKHYELMDKILDSLREHGEVKLEDPQKNDSTKKKRGKRSK